MINTDNATAVPGFCHEAVLYAGVDEFLDGTLQFVRDGFETGSPTLVVVSRPKIRALRAELAGDGERLYFADVERIGRNPACIIPAWSRFVEEHRDAAQLRGVGEPVWEQRSAVELAECHLHEALLNVTFEPSTPFWLRCPYDTLALDDEVIAAARRTHEYVVCDGVRTQRAVDRHLAATEFAVMLPEPTGPVVELAFSSSDDAVRVRHLVAKAADEAGVSRSRVADLALAVHELVTNTLRHSDGCGTVRLWTDAGSVVCEVRDRGRIADPLVGRKLPPVDAASGRGLWLTNHLADLVQLRSSASGTAVRVHVALGTSPSE